MQRRTARKILDDDETFDIELMADAVLCEKEQESKKKKRGGVKDVLKSWNEKRARIKKEEEFRQALARAWKRHHEK